MYKQKRPAAISVEAAVPAATSTLECRLCRHSKNKSALSTVDFSAVCNRENQHDQLGIIHLIDDSIIANTDSI
jgi:hypothetical protein